MEVTEMISRLSKLEYSLVHGGHRHSEFPNQDVIDEIKQVFETYPKLTKDSGFVDFLEMCSGAIIIYPDDSIDVSIYGVWDYSGDILSDTERIGERFLPFAGIMFHPPIKESDLKSLSFAFDISSDDLGVYRRANYADELIERSQLSNYTRYCDTFLDWLERLINTKGRLID